MGLLGTLQTLLCALRFVNPQGAILSRTNSRATKPLKNEKAAEHPGSVAFSFYVCAQR